MRRRKSTPRRLLSTPELARELGYSPRSVQMWRLQGVIEPETWESGRPRWRFVAVRDQLKAAVAAGRVRLNLILVGGGA